MVKFEFRNFSTDVEAAVNRLVNLHLLASCTYLSLGFYADRDYVALEDVGHFFCKLVEEKCEGTSMVASSSSRTCRSLPKMSVVKLRMPMETTTVMEKNPNQTFLNPHTQGSAHADPHIRDLEEEVKIIIIKKMSDHLTNLCRLAGPQAGLGKNLFRGSPSSMTRSLWSSEVLEGLLCTPLGLVLCLSLSLQPLGSLLTTLEPSPCLGPN
ncbi:ferritin light chain-like [Pteropus medius]|uniref:ferritin light chain-like n=1 Tax=Pteropus vampyrus TaxID=132908 RepID=UPI00196B1967|nr:ferritin light chain-like [Pteropus giganteus]